MKIVESYKNRILQAAAALVGFFLMFGSTDLSPFEIVMTVVGVMTIVYLLVQKTYRIPISWQNYSLAVFVLLIVAQLWLMPESDTLFALITVYLIAVYGLIQFWVTESRSIRENIVYGYLGGALASSVLGLGAYLSVLFRDNFGSVRFFWEDNIRISVFFDDPVVYGAFLVPAVLILSVYTCLAEKMRQFFILLFVTMLVFSNLILTGSRGAWLNFLVASIFFVILYTPFHTKHLWQKGAGVAMVGLFVALMWIFIIPIDGRSYYEATLSSRYYSSDKPRIENIQSASSQLVQRDMLSILFGSGSGSYEKKSENGFAAHNTYLRVLYEQGIVGIILYIAVLFFIFRLLRMRKRKDMLYTTLLASLLVGILVQNMFVDTLHWRHFWVLLSLVV